MVLQLQSKLGCSYSAKADLLRRLQILSDGCLGHLLSLRHPLNLFPSPSRTEGAKQTIDLVCVWSPCHSRLALYTVNRSNP
eukprot:1147430-Pelagomonas_calceolata.AAC.7